MNRQRTAYRWLMASVVTSVAAVASLGFASLLATIGGPNALLTLCAMGAMICGSAGTMAALAVTCRAEDLFQHPKLRDRNQIVMSFAIVAVMIVGAMSSAYSFAFIVPHRPN